MGESPSQIEDEPIIEIEYNCPIEEVSAFVLNTRAQDGSGRRTQFTPEQLRERLQSFLDMPNAVEIILKRNREIVGCAFSYEQDEEGLKKEVPYVNFFTDKGDRVFKIREVNVDPQYRRKGFAQAMMEQLIVDLRQKGATKLVLSTYPEEDDPANKLYKKLGFKEVAPNQEEHNYYMVYEYDSAENKKRGD